MPIISSNSVQNSVNIAGQNIAQPGQAVQTTNVFFDGGPSTVLALFCYGNVVPQTHLSMLRDCTHATQMATICSCMDELRAQGIDVDSAKEVNIKKWPLEVMHPQPDALVERSRAVTARDFLKKSNADVLIMCDHDLEWNGPSGGYEGDLCNIARRCAETKGIVGAVVSKKCQSQGVACIWKYEGDHEIPSNDIIEVHVVGAAFTAYHRSALQAVTDTMEEIPPGYSPVFTTTVVPHPQIEMKNGTLWPEKQTPLALSEDWAFCHYASELGFKSYVSLRPLIKHWGLYPYTVTHDSFKIDHLRYIEDLINNLEKEMKQGKDVEKKRGKVRRLVALHKETREELNRVEGGASGEATKIMAEE